MSGSEAHTDHLFGHVPQTMDILRDNLVGQTALSVGRTSETVIFRGMRPIS